MAKQPKTRKIRAGDETLTVPAPTKGEHGTMVQQSAEALAASRGALAGTMRGNVLARQKLIEAGASPGGDTPDGTTRTGIPQEDDLRAPDPAQPSTLPQDPGLVKVSASADGVTAGGAPGDAMSPADAQKKRDADAAEAEAKKAERKADDAKDRAEAAKRK